MAALFQQLHIKACQPRSPAERSSDFFTSVSNINFTISTWISFGV